jgi:hypothetical protein
MAERIQLDRDRPGRAPEDTVTESWVESPGIYLTIPTHDIRRTPRAADRGARSAKR